MPEQGLPPPESCLHNLHRTADRERDPPEPTDLCRNALGPFHMLDCPLFLARQCVYYEEAARPHPPVPDAEIAAARDALRRDFLGWSYRQRVRNLAKPRDLLKPRIALEAVAATADEAEQPLVLKVPVTAEPVLALAADGTPVDTSVAGVAESPPGEAPAESVAAAAFVVVTPTAETVPPIEGPGTAAPAASEMYPGQRRSEDRSSRKKKPRGPRTPQFHGGPAPARHAEVAPPGEGEAADDEAFGEGLDDGADLGPEVEIQAVVPVGPKTVEEYLAIVPDALVPDRPPQRRHGARDSNRDGNRDSNRDGNRQGDRGPRGPGRGQQGGQRRPGRPFGGSHGAPPHQGRQGGGGPGGGHRPQPPQGAGPGEPRQGGAPGDGPGAPRDGGQGGGPPRHGRHRRRRGPRPDGRPDGPRREGGGLPPARQPPSAPGSP